MKCKLVVDIGFDIRTEEAQIRGASGERSSSSVRAESLHGIDPRRSVGRQIRGERTDE